MTDVQAKLAGMTPEEREAIQAKVDAAYAAKQNKEADALLAEMANGKQRATEKVVPLAPRVRGAPQPAALNTAKPSLFKLEHWCDLLPPTGEEWLVKGLVPKQGVGTLFGASGAFKSFGAIDLAWHIAAGERWAGRRVNAAPVVYLAVEGSAGVRKRLSGARKLRGRGDARDPLYMVAAALNLGTGPEDAARMIASVEGVGVKPGLVVVDTLSASLARADENGQGMGAFLGNCQRIALRFDCLVIAVHHTGWGENAGRRERGHSSLPANVDMRILCEKAEDRKAAWTFEKVKDGPSGQVLHLALEEVVFGLDEDGDPITTLAVTSAVEVEKGDAQQPKSKGGRPPAQQTLLMEIVTQALIEEKRRSYQIPDGPNVPIVTEEAVCARYLMRQAETPHHGEDEEAFDKRRRRAFRARLKSALDSKLLIAGKLNGETVLWTPKVQLT
jgi:hypothetical protein